MGKIKKMYSSCSALLYLVLALTSLSVHAFLPEEQNSFSNSYNTSNSPQDALYKDIPMKEWTIVIYMAADNDLELFSRRNLAQLLAIGSNDKVTILVQLDTKVASGKKLTKRYYIERNRLVITNQNQEGMDSGNPETVIDCMRWASSYKANHYMLIFWNHGTGCIDVGKPRGLNTSALFNFNPITHMVELDRSVPFLDFAEAHIIDPRGICFDDTTGNYLTNQKLEYALQVITRDILKKKIDIIGFDACLMSMIEIASTVKDYADFMVSSQEVELGTGWDYHLAFAPLLTTPMSPQELAQHIVNAYEATYSKITPDYTQSALNLSSIGTLEKNIHMLAELLLIALTHQQDKTAYDTIKMCRHPKLCTHFDEPSYIDLHHFMSNLLNNLNRIKVNTTTQTKNFHMRLKTLIQESLELITITVIANVTGKNLAKAGGISIYFPDYGIHGSYRRTKFGSNSTWLSLLSTLLRL